MEGAYLGNCKVVIMHGIEKRATLASHEAERIHKVVVRALPALKSIFRNRKRLFGGREGVGPRANHLEGVRQSLMNFLQGQRRGIARKKPTEISVVRAHERHIGGPDCRGRSIARGIEQFDHFGSHVELKSSSREREALRLAV